MTDKTEAKELMLADISFRDYVATEAMAGILVNTARNGYEFGKTNEIVAKAYELADAMLKARG